MPPTRAVNTVIVVAVVAAAAMSLWRLTDPVAPVEFGISAVVFTVIMVVCWQLWRRSVRLARWAIGGFALAAVGITVVGSGPVSLAGVWAATLLVSLQFGAQKAWGVAAGVVTLAVLLHLFVGGGPESALIEGIGVALLSSVGVLFAQLITNAEIAVRERDRMLAEREEAAAALAATNARLQRELGTGQDLAIADERARTSHALHDGLGHRLTAVMLSLEFASQVRKSDPDAAWREVEVARTTTAEALHDMRRLVRALHPVSVAELTGPDALQAIADGFRSTGIDIRVEADTIAVDHEVQLLLLRFLQEGLTNVVRHSDATEVELRIATDAGVTASISDNGTPSTTIIEGFGLRAMRERAEALGGTLSVDAAPTGFRVTLRIPADLTQAGRGLLEDVA